MSSCSCLSGSVVSGREEAGGFIRASHVPLTDAMRQAFPPSRSCSSDTDYKRQVLLLAFHPCLSHSCPRSGDAHLHYTVSFPRCLSQSSFYVRVASR